MARPSEEFLLAWSSLSGRDPDSGWHAISLPAAGPVEVQAGRRSPDNAEAILFGFPSIHLTPAEKLPEGQGFSVERAHQKTAGRLWLGLTRRAAGSAELFTTMACDVVGSLDDAAAAGAGEAKLLRVFIARVNAWQEFMRKGLQALSPEAEIGLVGELTLLKAIIEAGVPPVIAVESWMGPFDHTQDFALGTGALEVKATLSVTGFPATIGSLEQLDDSIRQPLFLASVRLQQTDTGWSLPDWITATRESVRDEAEAARLLSERLIASGYFDAHAERYIRRFATTETRIMEVKENFPRLTVGKVPAGITKAMYEMDLDGVCEDSVAMSDVLKKLGAI